MLQGIVNASEDTRKGKVRALFHSQQPPGSSGNTESSGLSLLQQSKLAHRKQLQIHGFLQERLAVT